MASSESRAQQKGEPEDRLELGAGRALSHLPDADSRSVGRIARGLESTGESSCLDHERVGGASYCVGGGRRWALALGFGVLVLAGAVFGATGAVKSGGSCAADGRRATKKIDMGQYKKDEHSIYSTLWCNFLSKEFGWSGRDFDIREYWALRDHLADSWYQFKYGNGQVIEKKLVALRHGITKCEEALMKSLRLVFSSDKTTNKHYKSIVKKIIADLEKHAAVEESGSDEKRENDRAFGALCALFDYRDRIYQFMTVKDAVTSGRLTENLLIIDKAIRKIGNNEWTRFPELEYIHIFGARRDRDGKGSVMVGSAARSIQFGKSLITPETVETNIGTGEGLIRSFEITKENRDKDQREMLMVQDGGGDSNHVFARKTMGVWGLQAELEFLTAAKRTFQKQLKNSALLRGSQIRKKAVGEWADQIEEEIEQVSIAIDKEEADSLDSE